MRVRAPWIKHYYNADGKFYIIPNLDTVVLGGTLNQNSWDTSISQQVLCWHVLPVYGFSTCMTSRHSHGGDLMTHSRTCQRASTVFVNNHLPCRHTHLPQFVMRHNPPLSCMFFSARSTSSMKQLATKACTRFVSASLMGPYTTGPYTEL